MISHRIRIAIAAIGIVLSLSALPALSQSTGRSLYGPRVGFSTDPDQITVGAFMGFPEFTPGFRFRPSADLGLGNDEVSIAVNGDVEYDFPNATIEALPFAGAGLALFDSDKRSAEIGLNLYGGLEFDLGGYKSALVELRIGIRELPDIKLTGALGFF